MKSKLEIYALSVCFASVVCLVISIGIAGYSVFEIVAPELTMNSCKYGKYQTNEAYWKSITWRSQDEKAEARPNEEELTKRRQKEFVIAAKAEKRSGAQSLIRCLMFILASGITLLIHWKIAQRARAA